MVSLSLSGYQVENTQYNIYRHPKGFLITTGREKGFSVTTGRKRGSSVTCSNTHMLLFVQTDGGVLSFSQTFENISKWCLLSQGGVGVETFLFEVNGGNKAMSAENSIRAEETYGLKNYLELSVLNFSHVSVKGAHLTFEQRMLLVRRWGLCFKLHELELGRKWVGPAESFGLSDTARYTRGC